MICAKRIPATHRAVAEIAVKAVLGERAVIAEMVEIPSGPSFRTRVGALHYGIRTFWDRWSGRHASGGSDHSDETQD